MPVLATVLGPGADRMLLEYKSQLAENSTGMSAMNVASRDTWLQRVLSKSATCSIPAGAFALKGPSRGGLSLHPAKQGFQGPAPRVLGSIDKVEAVAGQHDIADPQKAPIA